MEKIIPSPEIPYKKIQPYLESDADSGQYMVKKAKDIKKKDIQYLIDHFFGYFTQTNYDFIINHKGLRYLQSKHYCLKLITPNVSKSRKLDPYYQMFSRDLEMSLKDNSELIKLFNEYFPVKKKSLNAKGKALLKEFEQISQKMDKSEQMRWAVDKIILLGPTTIDIIAIISKFSKSVLILSSIEKISHNITIEQILEFFDQMEQNGNFDHNKIYHNTDFDDDSTAEMDLWEFILFKFPVMRFPDHYEEDFQR
jgi:hypothetical protein